MEQIEYKQKTDLLFINRLKSIIKTEHCIK